MSISFVGAATGTTSATLPAHAAGDVLLAFAHRDGNTTAPSLPAGWTDLGSSGANVNSSRIGYKVAASSGETSGTWTNATGLVVLVYRGCAAGDPIGDVVGTGSSSLIISYPALTMQVTDGSSWVVGVAGHRSNDTTGFGTAPSGMTNRSYVQDATATIIGNDTAGGVSSWSAQTVTATGTSGGWRSWSVELLAAAEAGGVTVDPSSGSVLASGQSPVVGQPRALSPSAGAGSIGGGMPTINQPHIVDPASGAVLASGGQSLVDQPAGAILPSAGAIVAAGYSPTILQQRALSPGAGGLSYSGHAPEVDQPTGAVIRPSAGQVLIGGYSPSLSQPRVLAPASTAIVVAGYAPTISQPIAGEVLPPVRCVGSHALAASITAARSAAACAGSHRAAASVTTTVRPIP